MWIKIIMLTLAIVSVIATSDTMIGNLFNTYPGGSAAAVGALIAQITGWLQQNGFIG